VEDLSSRCAQEALDDHLNVAQTIHYTVEEKDV